MNTGKTKDRLREWFGRSVTSHPRSRDACVALDPRSSESATQASQLQQPCCELASSAAPNQAFQVRLLWIVLPLVITVLIFHLRSTRADPLTPQQQTALAAKTIGPDGDNDNACSKCHTMEFDAWQTTTHFSSFITRQQDPRAKMILDKMGFKSMKRQAECRQCHFTSIMDDGKLTPTWGVVCESCHGPAADWVGVHNKLNGDPNAAMLKWGTGKDQTPQQRQTRLDAAKAKGMVHSQMIYELAVNCMSCHGIPDETLVNKGGHQPGSDFDLVAWSQGEVRHNFADSPGAPDHPTNRPASAQELRRLYIVGIMVDLEFTVRNLALTHNKTGNYEKAAIARFDRIRAKLTSVLGLVAISELSDAVKLLPDHADGSNQLPADLADRLSDLTRDFVAKNDGSKLSAIDGLIPKSFVGKPAK